VFAKRGPEVLRLEIFTRFNGSDSIGLLCKKSHHSASHMTFCLPGTMGLPKPVERQTLSINATKVQSSERDGIAENFGTETYKIGLGLENPQIEGSPSTSSSPIAVSNSESVSL